MSDTNEATEVVPKTTLSITVDGRPHEAQPGQLVIDACEDAGTYVPRFCYHKRMTPVGMCRQCLVEVEGPRGPMLVVSCMTPVAEGQVVQTETPTVKRSQEAVLEFLLANHPLDCPVCDKGGECPLQDQAMSHGPGESRFVEEKRHFEKPIAISELVFLDRERCILCDRCTRFADEVAGDKLISFTHRGNQTQVLTFPDEPFSSYFSGNTVQICPVGALTAKPYRFKARPWDLEQVESTCTSCAVGCRVVVQSSRDDVLRLQGVDSDPVNWGWLCDRGRFNFEAVNSEQRLGTPAIRQGDTLVEASWETAMAKAVELIQAALASDGPSGIGIIGGARGSNEDAFAWARLAADVIGTTNVDAQLGDGLPAEVLGLPRATIDEACSATTLIVLGVDLKEELPVLYLRVRDAAEKRKIRLLELSQMDSGLTRYAWKSRRHRSGEQVAAIRDALADAEISDQIGSGNVVVIAGRGNLAESDGGWTTGALATLLAAVPGATVLPAFRRGNVVGALQLGLRPTGDGARHAGDARSRGQRQARLPRPARRRPAARLPRCRPCPPRLGRRSFDHRRRHLRHDVVAARRRRARRRGLRREGWHDDEPRRPSHDARQEGLERRHRPARLDDRHRAGAAARRRPRLSHRRADHRCDRGDGDRVRRRDHRCVAAAPRRCAELVRRDDHARRSPVTSPSRRTATTTGSS